jgi:hypothetical protein
MLTLKKVTGLIVFFFLVIASTLAQLPQQPQQPAEVSDAEIGQFANAFKKIQSIDQQVQGKMISVIQEKGIEVQRFNEIRNAQQDPDKEVDADEDEIKKFESANQEIEKIQNIAQQDMQKQITDAGLTVNRYQEIMIAVKNDPVLQEKLQKFMEEE